MSHSGCMLSPRGINCNLGWWFALVCQMERLYWSDDPDLPYGELNNVLGIWYPYEKYCDKSRWCFWWNSLPLNWYFWGAQNNYWSKTDTNSCNTLSKNALRFITLAEGVELSTKQTFYFQYIVFEYFSLYFLFLCIFLHIIFECLINCEK